MGVREVPRPVLRGRGDDRHRASVPESDASCQRGAMPCLHARSQRAGQGGRFGVGGRMQDGSSCSETGTICRPAGGLGKNGPLGLG
ncbi:hypothetical protein AAFF_G00199090 [Aldrovandia affinis]|uniref:Uncharacterized protein n=1 Tax=Aldrovandia affinis TaxID=143900 RepID=A0AAD7W614_9TELE|nr:hypothetical protein AAFF_G00199090 [Aldrovandia affinis]